MSLKDLDSHEAEALAKLALNPYYTSVNSDNYESESYMSKMRKLKPKMNTTEEYGSSEYGATSEYGLDPSSSSSDDSSPEAARKGSTSRHSGPA